MTVIMSCYNVENYVEKALSSILNQGYANLEVLIADDGSSDSTKTIIDSIQDPRIRRFHNDANLGLLHTWNKLLLQTQGLYVTFQDGDDLSLPGRLEKLVLFMEANPDIGLCGTNFIRYFDTWGLSRVSNYPLTDELIREEFERGVIPFNGTRVMIRREVYDAVGGFRDFFKGLAAEDFDWILRISERYKMANIPDVLYEYRYFSKSASKYATDSPVERVFVTKIIFFLAEQRRKHGVDALQTGMVHQVTEFLAPYKIELKNDLTNYIRYNKVFGNALANKDFNQAVSLWSKRLIKYPLQKGSIYDFYRLSSGFIRTLSKSFLYRITGKARYSSLHHSYGI